MPSKQEYLGGTYQAELTLEQVQADWGSGSWSLHRLELANRAFEIYYTAINRILEVTDEKHSMAMYKQLYDAKEEGWGFGVNCLDEAFGHLADNSGDWSDDNTEKYNGGPNKCFNRTNVKGPEAMVNFLDEVDKSLNKLSKVSNEFGKQWEYAEQGKVRDDWGMVGKALGHIKTGAENAQPWLWTAPAAQKWAGRAVTFTDVTGKIHSAVTLYASSRNKFSGEEVAALEALQLAVSYLPVLGGFYSEAVALIPTLKKWFDGVIACRTRQADYAQYARSCR